MILLGFHAIKGPITYPPPSTETLYSALYAHLFSHGTHIVNLHIFPQIELLKVLILLDLYFLRFK